MNYLKPFVLLVLCAALIGCAEESTSPSASPSAGDKQPMDGPTVSIAGQEGFLKDGTTAQGQQVAEGYGMTWSESALDEQIPALPIFGFANGQPFNAGTVLFFQDDKGLWHLEVNDHPFDPAKGIAHARFGKPDTQAIHITLPERPTAGAVLGREMEYGQGYFQIKKTPHSADTTSWNASFAYKLQIDEWMMEEVTAGSCGQSVSGQASGTLFIAFKGSQGGIRNSWVSGQFKEAPILQCRR